MSHFFRREKLIGFLGSLGSKSTWDVEEVGCVQWSSGEREGIPKECLPWLYLPPLWREFLLSCNHQRWTGKKGGKYPPRGGWHVSWRGCMVPFDDVSRFFVSGFWWKLSRTWIFFHRMEGKERRQGNDIEASHQGGFLSLTVWEDSPTLRIGRFGNNIPVLRGLRQRYPVWPTRVHGTLRCFTLQPRQGIVPVLWGKLAREKDDVLLS